MLARSLAVVGVLEESSSMSTMNFVRISVSLSSCMPALSSRQQFCRSSGVVGRCGVRNLKTSVGSRRNFGATLVSHPGLSLGCNPRRGRRILVRAKETGSSNAEQEDGSRTEGNVRSQEAVPPEAASEPAVEAVTEDVVPADPANPADEAEWVKLRDRFVSTLGQLKEQQTLYRQDVDYWGLGTSPIFTVYQDANDQVTRVEVNHDEILRRTGLEPSLPQLDDENLRAEADSKLARAHVMAGEIEAGLRDAPVGSTIYEFKKEQQAVGKELGAGGVPAGRGGLMSLVGQAGDLVSRTPPWARQTFFGFMFIYLFFIVWGARALVSEELQKKQEEEDQKEREERLLKRKELRSQDGKEVDGTTVGQDGAGGSTNPVFGSGGGIDAQAFRRFRPDIDKDEFRKKVEHIQAMARQARLSEKERSHSDPGNDEFNDDVADDVGDEVEDAREKQPTTLAAGGLGNSGSNWSSLDKAGVNGSASGVFKNLNGNPQDFDGTVRDEATNFDTWSKSNTMDPLPTFPSKGVESVVLEYVSQTVPKDGTVSSEEVAVRLEDSVDEKEEEAKLESDAQAPNGAINRTPYPVEEGNGGTEPEAQAEGQELSTLGNTGYSQYPNENMSSARANGKVGGFRSMSRGSRPKVIISVEEARARIAAKKAKRGGRYSNSGDEHEPAIGRQERNRRAGTDISASREGIDVDKTSPYQAKTNKFLDGDAVEAQDLATLHDEPTEDRLGESESRDQAVWPSLSEEVEDSVAVDRISRLDALMQSVVDDLWEATERLHKPKPAADSSAPVAAEQNEVAAEGKKGDTDKADEEGTPGLTTEEKEELTWMRDDVLREIVFKVQANEQAGRDPFEGLNSEDEARFFRGLERKFEREGDVVKRWIEERVENLDYGKGPIGVDDPPEKYQLRWKGDPPKRSEFLKKFHEDRLRILEEANARVGPSEAAKTDADDSVLESEGKDGEKGDGRGTSSASSSSQAKTQKVKSQSPDQSSGKSTSEARKSVVTAAGKPKEVQQNFEHTKRWSRELRRKYEMEKDPETKAIIKEIGQDLDRWITDDEVLRAESLLSQGAEGESEYVKIAYEKTKEKIKQQREKFGQEAMVAKYREYKPQKENELWWLDLPFVVCIGMQRVSDGETEEGIFSLDLSPGLEGTGKVMRTPHTVAFQDRTEATQFLYMMKSQSDPDLASAELVPMAPKELYKDAKADGYNVLVLKKGQLQLTPGQAFEEVESRIVEIGCSKYWDEVLRERSIDMNAVLDEGLGYGRSSM